MIQMILCYKSGKLKYVYSGTPTEKVWAFLDSQLKPVMQSSRSYIKDSGDFTKKIKNIGAFLRIPSWLPQILWGYILVFLMRQKLRL